MIKHIKKNKAITIKGFLKIGWWFLEKTLSAGFFRFPPSKTIIFIKIRKKLKNTNKSGTKKKMCTFDVINLI